MKLELCVGSLEAARLASQLPVDRIETCNALEQGGLTPSTAMVAWIKNTFDLEQHVLIRQSAGGFCYTYDEIVVMRDQILQFRELDVHGVVIGALTSTGQIDTTALEAWKRAAGEMDLTFHRAFDEVSDWKKALDELVKLGFKRILTSGHTQNVAEGKSCLVEMITYAAGRIEIMAGGGVNEQTVREIANIGLDAIHFSGTVEAVKDPASLFKAQLLLPHLPKMQAIIQQLNSVK